MVARKKSKWCGELQAERSVVILSGRAYRHPEPKAKDLVASSRHPEERQRRRISACHDGILRCAQDDEITRTLSQDDGEKRDKDDVKRTSRGRKNCAPISFGNGLTTRGQALIEMIFIMPLIITLIIWLLQGVEVVKASAEHQKYLRLNLFLRLNNYAKYSVDALGTTTAGDPQPVPHDRDFMAIEHNPQLGQKMIAGSLGEFQRRGGSGVNVRTKFGICLRPDCD